jgi:hypothetical protein
MEDDREGYLAHAKQEAEALLRDNWHLVDKVAAALLRRQELSRAELLEVCELKPDLPSDALPK